MPQKKKPQSDDTLEMVVNDFNRSWEYTSGSWHDRWQNNHYLYNNQRVKRGYSGITDTFVPMSFSTVETLVSGLFGGKPKFSYLPPNTKPNQKTDILNGLLDFFWDKDQWSIKVINTGRSMLKLGTGVDFFFWDKDHPRMINIPLRDFFIAPESSVLDEGSTAYCGRRYLTTKQELETFEIVDFDVEPDAEGNLPMKKKYTNLDKIKGGSQGDNTDKQEKDMWYGSTVAEPEDKQIEVIEYWTTDKVISVANRSVVIENFENYFKAKARANGDEYAEGILPFADARDYVDESLFYAKGEIDIIGDQNELLNDLTNQNIDSVTYTLNQMYTLDPKYAPRIKEVQNIPGAVYPFEAGSLVPITRGTVPPEAFNERMNIKNEIRETTASNEVVKGIGSQEGGYFHRMAKIIFKMVQLYVTEPMMVRILGKDGARWELFDPQAFSGEYEPRVQLDVTINNDKQNQANNAKELLGAFLGDPDVNQQELKKLVLQRSFELDPDEVEALMQPNPMAGGVPEMQEAMPEQVDPLAQLLAGGQGMQALPGGAL